MEKTVKELIKENITDEGWLEIDEYEDLILRIEKAHENEIAEKDKIIETLGYDNSEYLKIIKRNADEKQLKLFKEDFEDLIICSNCNTLEEYCYMKNEKDNYYDYYRKVQFKNDDYSKYDLLPSKEES